MAGSNCVSTTILITDLAEFATSSISRGYCRNAQNVFAFGQEHSKIGGTGL
jgi:hypothetical protein